MFILKAEKTQLTVQEKEPVTSGSAGIYPVRFEFSADWDGLDKTAVFQAGCRETAVRLSGTSCEVPAEPLAQAGPCLMCGVCGRMGNAVVLPTVWANLGMILEGVPAGGTHGPGPDPEEGYDHNLLTHREDPEQHPIEAISGLDEIPNRRVLEIWNGG